MDPRALELSDIVKVYLTEEALLATSVMRDDMLYVSKDPFTVYHRKNNGELEKFDTITPFFTEVIKSLNAEVALRFIGEGDDKGLSVEGGQLSVGLPGDGRETTLGEGDSYPVPIAFHCDIANTTDLVVTDALDITTILQSDVGSATGVFGGTATGKYILVGSDHPFSGVKVKLNSVGVIEPENVLAEYLMDDTPTWSTAFFMATDSDYPYAQRGWQLGTGLQEHWRFGFNPFDLPTSWDLATLTINGEEITKYWARFRITADITTDPQVEQMKIHSNRMEINADGTSEYFGRSRYAKTLIFGMESIVENKLFAPASRNVDYGENLIAGYIDNQFANNSKDGFSVVQNIEEGMDTSVPVILTLSYFVDGTATGDIQLIAEVFQVSDGFVYDGTAEPEVYSGIDTVSVDSNLVRRTLSFLIFVNKLTPKDAIIISIYRNAQESNLEDTLEGNIIMTNVALTGYFWKP